MLIPRKAQLLLASTLALTMLLPSLGSPIALASLGTAVVLDPARKIHPMLQAGVELDPTSLVRVIVQKTKADQKTACVSETSTSVLKTSAAVCLVADSRSARHTPMSSGSPCDRCLARSRQSNPFRWADRSSAATSNRAPARNSSSDCRSRRRARPNTETLLKRAN